MRHLAILLVLLAGCSSKIGASVSGAQDARPISFQKPPKPDKDGDRTAAGCEGVTAGGSCKKGDAVYCDLSKGRVRITPCKSLGRECVVDVGRGAKCKDLGDSSGPSSVCTDTNISKKGLCLPDGSAVFCDTVTKPDKPYTRSWKCSDSQKTCNPDGCGNEGDTAFCCDGKDTPPKTECGSIDEAGVCDAATNTVKWCSSSAGGSLLTKDCSTSGRTCKVDACIAGEAWCCGDVVLDPTSECAVLGIDGVCTADGKVRYCLTDAVHEFGCFGTDTCQVDTCGTGANCCPPGNPGIEPACAALGYEGECTAAGEVHYCYGTKDSEISTFSCPSGQTCGDGVCGTGANCCDISPLCGGASPTIPISGRCLDNKVQTCSAANQVVEESCYITGKTCVDGGLGCGGFGAACCPTPCSPSGFPACAVGTCTANGFGEYFCM